MTVIYKSDISYSRFKGHKSLIILPHILFFLCICTFLAQLTFLLFEELLGRVYQMKKNTALIPTYEILGFCFIIQKASEKKKSELSMVVTMHSTFKEAQWKLLSLYLPLFRNCFF